VIVLAHGYKLPESGDKGSVWFPALEDNIEQCDSHDHDGVNSALIGSQNVQSGLVNANAADWGVAISPGTYRQLVTVPTGFTWNGANKEVRLSTGHIVFPTLEKVSASTFYVYTNDNSLTYTISFR
jgi:hypothetical protein